MSRFASTTVLVLAASVATVPACEAAPQEIPVAIGGRVAPADPRQIADYPSAIQAIIQIITGKLALTVPQHPIRIYPTRKEFAGGLIEQLGLDPALARSTASFAKAAVGVRGVLINEVEVAGLTWPERIELLAHELAHTVQLELTGYRPLNREQWLTEGFAEWLAYTVTDAMGLDHMGQVRERIVGQLQALGGPRALPRLGELDAFPHWIEARRKYGYAATFSLSYLAVEFLMERHSYAATLDYFRRFRDSDDYRANFRTVFGEPLEAFEAALTLHLEKTLDRSKKGAQLSYEVPEYSMIYADTRSGRPTVEVHYLD